MRKILISLLPFLFLNSYFGYRIIEDFESGSITLYSYPNEDSQPNFWRLDTIITHNNSRYSLKLYGNTWKIESIIPQRIDTNSIWQVACYIFIWDRKDNNGKEIIPGIYFCQLKVVNQRNLIN